MIKLLIFDLDGTLFDTAPGISKAVNLLIQAHGEPPIADSTIRTFIGNGLEALIRQLDAKAQKRLGEVDDLIAEFRRLYKDTLLENTTPFAGVTEFLRQWPDQIAIVSNKHDDYVRVLVERSPLAQFDWAHVCGGNTHARPKPSAIPLQKAMLAAGAKPHETIMIGDGLPDILAAKAAKTKSIAIEFGYSPIDELLAAGADARLANYDKLSEVIQFFC